MTAAAASIGVYAVAYVDLVLRARSAYQEGEKYLLWDREPGLKTAHFDAWLKDEGERLRASHREGALGAAELKERLDLARFERDMRVSESSLKYAAVWFSSAVELFSPPESRWVVLSRAKLALARELWKKELEAKKIPYQDYMLE